MKTPSPIKAYALPQKFRLTARGMKPLTRHFFYFDGVDSGSSCHPNGGVYGGNLVTDKKGELVFHFHYRTPSTLNTTFATATEARNALVGNKSMILRTTDNTSIASAVVQVVAANVASSNWSGGGIGLGGVGIGSAAAGAAAAGAAGVCFTADTKVSMANGKTKMIKNVKPGDKVFNHDKSAVNTVKYVEYSVVETELYSPDYSTPFATKAHPLYIDGVLSSPYPKETYRVHPWLGMTKALDNMAMTEPVVAEVYNLWVDGDGTFIVNGFGTTSIIGDGGAVRNLIEQELISHDDAMKLAKRFANSNRFTSYGAYIYNRSIATKISNISVHKAELKVMLSDNLAVKTLVNTALGIVGAGAILNNNVKKLFTSK